MKVWLMIKYIFGSLALLLAFVGIFLPVWPTTPFVLVAMGCFSTMPAVQDRLMGISFFKQYYDGYHNGVGLPLKTLRLSLTILWATLLISMILTQKIWLTLLLLGIGIGVTLHILHIAKGRTSRRNKKDE